MKKVNVLAPATVANVGCGYDTIGFALDGIYEEIVISERDDNELVIDRIDGADLSMNPGENVATIAAKSLLDYLGINRGFTFIIKKHFNPGSGLGSSASSAAGAVFGVNSLLSNPLSSSELLPFALEGEAFASKSYHADNVAPSLLGGFIVMRSYDPLDYFTLPVAEELSILIARPAVEVKTSEAKGLVPMNIEVSTARNQWGNVAALTHSLHTKDWSLMKKSIEDLIAEPVRKNLIPGYEESRSIASANRCVGFNISGSGPSFFMLFESPEDLEKTKREIMNLYERSKIDCDFFESKMSNQGCRLID